jgi:RPA family protein
MKRESAWRVFAGEYNDSTYEIKGSGEKTPSYVVTPLGAKINRLFLVGVLTDVENVSEGGEFIRAHISDPTGVFTVYSGQYQSEATEQLLQIEVPAFVAVVGKTRTYEPEDGMMYVSVRPELVREVTADLRDRWIIETCDQSKHRIGAMIEALKMNQPNAFDLRKLGYSRELSQGLVAAVKAYEHVDVTKYIQLVRESLQYITPDRDKFEEIEEVETEEAKEQKPASKKKETKEKPKESVVSEETEDAETLVLDTIKELEGEEGALWDAIVEQCKKNGLDENAIDEALTSLMDKGFIFEPVLGIIKTT